jgi:rod shape-determining protein MreB
MDSAIINHLKKTYNVLIGERSAELIKMNIGSALWDEPEEFYEIRGRDLISGLPKPWKYPLVKFNLPSRKPLSKSWKALRNVSKKLRRSLASDNMDRGIVLAGGGALLRGLDKLIGRRPICRFMFVRNRCWR